MLFYGRLECMEMLSNGERGIHMGNLLSVLTSPTATFQRLKEQNGGWVLPMIVLIVLSLIGAWLIAPTTEAMINEQLAKTPGLDPALAELTKTSAAVTAYSGAILGIPLSIFIGGLLLLLLNLIVRGEATYMQLVKVALFSKVPGIISMLLVGVMTRVTAATSLYDVGLNAGVFVEDKTSTSVPDPVDSRSVQHLGLGAGGHRDSRDDRALT